MTDKPSIELDLAVGGNPAAANSSVTLDVSLSAVLPLPAVRVEVDEVRGGLILELVRGADGLLLTPRLSGPDGPSGADISLELPGVTGGGRLLLDNGEWRGAVTVVIGSMKVAGYGLLAPNSLLIVLSGRFPEPGIQVGFGFAISGVAGIFGVNRRTDTQALTAAVQDGSLGNLLFPNDPEHDMPVILNNLPRMFPERRGQALFGPMLEINWAGGLLKAQVAMILEAPAPVRLSFIGRLVVDLPAAGVALVHIQATFAAIVDLSVPEFRLIASLTGSYIVGITLTGDLLLLIRGGPDATFVLSVGGFHPAVHPPAGVPALQRVGMALGLGIAELRFETYFAVTTCSVQFGAKAELTASVAGCGVHGWFGFDALFEWDPFHFRVDVTAGVEIEVFGATLLGIRLSGTLEGPAPWHIRAHGEVDILFISISITIDETFGDDDPAQIAYVPDVATGLVGALRDSSAWTLQPPSADTDGVVLSPTAAADVAAGRLFHPAGRLQVRQRLLPFELEIDRFGGYGVPKQCWQLVGVRLREGVEPVPFAETVDEQFALGMFRTMTHEEQLSSTSFSMQQCGGVISPKGVTVGDTRTTDLDWDTIVVGPELTATSLDAAHLAALRDVDLAPYIPTRGRAIDIKWAVGDQVKVLAETPAVVVSDVPVVGLVPTPVAAPFATSARAIDSARQLTLQGTKAAVVEQWELT
jgi:hypothetical protein